MKAWLDHTEDIALNIQTFWFKPEEKFDYLAGQFGRWTIPHEDADDRGTARWFTLSSSPTEKLISITTKFSEKDGSSLKARLKDLKKGDEISLTAPMGDFVLPQDENIPLVFIAGGIGCTPFRSIAKFIQDTGEKRNIHLIYAVSKDTEIAFKDLFESIYKPFTLIVGERLDASKILDLTSGFDNKLFYFSGPKPMVMKLVEETKEKGLSDNQIILDYFPGYVEI